VAIAQFGVREVFLELNIFLAGVVDLHTFLPSCILTASLLGEESGTAISFNVEGMLLLPRGFHVSGNSLKFMRHNWECFIEFMKAEF
jgi:hypothetical protein